MPTYLINAKKEILFEIEVEADNPDEAVEKLNNIENLEQFANYSIPLEIEEIEELEIE